MKNYGTFSVRTLIRENMFKVKLAFLLLEILVATAQGSDECPDGFTYLPLAQSCYKVVYEAHTWESADTKCRQLNRGAHLAAITSREKNNALKSFLRDLFDSNPTESVVCEVVNPDWRNFGKMLWTSGQRLNENNCADVFVWKAGGDEQLPFDFTDWQSSQPDCWLNNEHSVQMVASWDYRWNDAPSNLRICPLCEYQPA